MSFDQEAVDLAVQEQEQRKATYEALKARGLPIADDLRRDFDPRPDPIGKVVLDLTSAAKSLLDFKAL